MATTDETLTAIDTEINALVADQQVDYKEGDVEVKAGQKIKQLLALRKHLLNHPQADISTVQFAFGVSQFGEDHTIHENDTGGG